MVEPIGRRAERDALAAALAAAEEARRVVVHVRAAAGMGKSTLLDDATARARSRGHHVLSGGLSAAETGLSWAGLVTLLQRVPDGVVPALPAAQRDAVIAATGGGPGDADPMSVAAGLAAVLRSLAASAPVTVVVDDVHWLDQATASALSFAIRSTEAVGCAFVLASRPVDLPMQPERLTAPEDHRLVTLDGLSLAGVRLLLDEHVDAPVGRIDLIRLHETTAGNPLHVIEAGRLLAAGHSVDDAVLPPSLQAVVATHLQSVDAAVLPVLRTAALAAVPTVPLLAAVFERAEVDAALAAAEAAALLRVEAGRVVFRHPVMIAGLLDGIGSYERRRLHAMLAAAVEDDEERAVHLAAAAEGRDEGAADAMAAAASAALRRGAVHLAAERFLRSWELTPDGHPTRLMRRVHAADAFDMAGDAATAMPMHREAVDAAVDPAERWEATLGLVISTAHAVSEVAAADLVDALKDAAGDDLQRQLRARQIAVRLRLFNGAAGAHEEAQALLALARLADDPEVRLEAEATHVITSIISGEPCDVDGLLAACLAQWGEESPVPGRVAAEPLVWTEHPAAIAVLERSLAAAEQAGSLVHVANDIDQLADAHLRAGNWATARGLLERYCDLGVATDEMVSIAPRLGDLAYLDALEGRPEDALHRLASAAVARQSHLERVQVEIRRGQVLLLGGSSAALEPLLAAHQAFEAAGMVDLCAAPFRADLVEALVTDGRVDDASALAALMRARAGRSQRARAVCEAMRATALVAAARGDLAGAEAAAVAALDAARELAAPLELARAQLLCGVLARRAGRRAEARNRLHEAREIVERLGALPLVARVSAELARCGEERAAGAVTPTERRIAELVRDGRTNAEIAAELFVSVRTVESNLTKLYRKLGVRSRTELARRVGDGGVD